MLALLCAAGEEARKGVRVIVLSFKGRAAHDRTGYTGSDCGTSKRLRPDHGRQFDSVHNIRQIV